MYYIGNLSAQNHVIIATSFKSKDTGWSTNHPSDTPENFKYIFGHKLFLSKEKNPAIILNFKSK